MKQKINYILAICIGIIPLYMIMIWYRLTHDDVFTITDMLVYPIIFGGGNILLILALNKYLLKKRSPFSMPGKENGTGICCPAWC